MKIWLDDIRNPPDDSWTWAKSADQFVILLDNSVEEISFDHDIASFTSDGREITGYHCLCLVEDRAMTDPFYSVPRMSVHSANPVGRIRMEKVINKLTVR